MKRVRTRSPGAVRLPQVCPILVFLSYVGLLQTIFPFAFLYILWLLSSGYKPSPPVSLCCAGQTRDEYKRRWLWECHLHCLLLFNHPVSYLQQGKWRRDFHLVCELILGSLACWSPHLRVHIVDERCLSLSSPPPSSSWSQLSTIFHFCVGLNSFFLLNTSQGHFMFLCCDYWTL